MSKLNFTKEKLNQLPIQDKRYSVLDTLTPYLRVIIYPSGIKTFMLCRKVEGKTQFIKIGRVSDLTIEQARKKAVLLNSLIALGNNPQAEKQEKRMALTFKELFDYYYQQHLLHFTKHPKENKRTIELNVFPAFGNLKAIEFTAEKARKLHTTLAKNTSPANSNRVMSIVSAAFNFCIKNSYYTGVNPCTSVKKFRTTSRDRFLSRDELVKFFDAVKEEDELFQHFFLMLLYTGARKSNVLSMKWADIDFDLRRWRISEKETKNQDVNIVYLSHEAIAILRMRLQNMNTLGKETLFVFDGTGKSGHLNDPKKAFDRIKSKMKINNFRMHDLRRTLGSYMAIGGASLPMIGKALNHKSQVSTAIYARLSQEPVLDAINNAMSLIKGTV